MLKCECILRSNPCNVEARYRVRVVDSDNTEDREFSICTECYWHLKDTHAVEMIAHRRTWSKA